MKKHCLKIIGFVVVFIVLTGVLAGCDNAENFSTVLGITSEESKYWENSEIINITESSPEESIDESNDKDFIKFKYVYRGFTPFFDDEESFLYFYVANGISIFTTIEDYSDFTSRYCKLLGFVSDYNFSEKYYIAICHTSPSQRMNIASAEIDKIFIIDSEIIVTYKDNINVIYCSGTSLYIDVIEVDINDIPSIVNGIYKK